MKINLISAFGDPKSPKTWSGTTNNVYKALLAADSLGETYSACDNNILYKAAKQVMRLYYKLAFYKGKNHMMMPFRFKWWRYLSAQSGHDYLKSAETKNLLHFSTLSLPMITAKNGENHYCLIDATWDIWSKGATNMDVIKPADRQVIEQLDAKSFQQVKHIFSISEYVKTNLIEHYQIPATKITVVGTGTGIIQPFYGKKDYSNGNILFVAKGRFEDKGGKIVLEAFEHLLKSFPNLTLSIIGQNDYSGFIKHPNIKTYGFIDLEQLQDIFNTCSLFIMPALHEPWGLVYIEAMLCKMPIVGLNKNSFPELSQNGKFGIGADSPDPIALALKISILLSDPARMEEMGLSAQAYAVENYSWAKVVSKIINAI